MRAMTIQAIVHKAEEGGYWAEVPSIPGCATQGETMDELRANLRERSPGAWLFRSMNRSKIPKVRFWKSPFEEFIGQRVHPPVTRNGWTLERVQGSHQIFVKKGETVRISVPVHGNRPLKKGLQAHLTKLAGLPRE